MAATDDPTPILVVDDDEDVRTTLEWALQPLGRPIRSAATAAEALAAARELRPALVLLDVNLPDLSGYEVCRELRDAYGEELPIVFISGHRTEEYDRAAGFMLGADDYIVKPFVLGDLIARLRRAIDRTSTHAETAASALTERELEVLAMLASGARQDVIAQRLVIAPKTVATHIQHILAKLSVHSRAEAVAYAHRNGLSGSN
jgi:DNA-binding NarL/FixJ family response regulator